MRWLQIIIGLWIMLSPWLLGFQSISIMMWSNLLLGMALVLLNLWAIYGGQSQSQTKNK